MQLACSERVHIITGQCWRRSTYSTTICPLALEELGRPGNVLRLSLSIIAYRRIGACLGVYGASRVFGQQRASCSVRHRRVVHIPHRYAISSQDESPFSKRAV